MGKRGEPDWFAKWRMERAADPTTTADWERFHSTHTRKRLHAHLLTEQGLVCCYCGVKLAAPPDHAHSRQDKETSHIEHVVPKDGPSGNAARVLDYANLLVSCDGLSRPGAPPHCGHAKGGRYDAGRFVSPLDPACEAAFACEAQGTVVPAHPDLLVQARHTIDALCLNHEALRDRRADAIARYVTGEVGEPDLARFLRACLDGRLRDEYGLTDDRVARLASSCRAMDGSGRHVSFGSEIASVLETYA